MDKTLSLPVVQNDRFYISDVFFLTAKQLLHWFLQQLKLEIKISQFFFKSFKMILFEHDTKKKKKNWIAINFYFAGNQLPDLK